MLDIKLNSNGDFDVTQLGDIQLVDNPLQDAKTAILWIKGEWRLNPEVGLPWFDDFLVKNAKPEIIIQMIREKLLDIDGIDDAEIEMQEIDRVKRSIVFSFTIYSNGETYSEEVEISG